MRGFITFPKTSHLFRDAVITEKIDGVTSCITVSQGCVAAWARSRNGIGTLDNDNFGFAKWVRDNEGALSDTLGPGKHYGEWWGHGIKRGYGREKGDRRFSLFNTERWGFEQYDRLLNVDGLDLVPILHTGVFSEHSVRNTLDILSFRGSYAAPGYMNPEGLCVFHTQSKQIYKVLMENDHLPKSMS